MRTCRRNRPSSIWSRRFSPTSTRPSRPGSASSASSTCTRISTPMMARSRVPASCDATGRDQLRRIDSGALRRNVIPQIGHVRCADCIREWREGRDPPLAFDQPGRWLMDSSLIIELAINGALIGLMYALVALGIVLIYKTSGLANLAQGAIAMTGAYVTWAIAYGVGAPIWLAIPLALVLVFGVVRLIGRLARRRRV